MATGGQAVKGNMEGLRDAEDWFFKRECVVSVEPAFSFVTSRWQRVNKTTCSDPFQCTERGTETGR